jgi:hypothetical protein
MSERAPAYVGVSGVVSPEQQATLTETFRECFDPSSRVLALGVKATHKTQFLDVENKYGAEWYPVGDQLSQVLVADSDQLQVAQVFIDPELAADPAYRSKFMERISDRGAPWLSAVQFDMLPWHSDPTLPGFIEEAKEETDVKVLLQAHSGILETHTPEQLARKLNDYATDYVLLDSSHGKGVRLDLNRLRPYIDALYSSPALDHVGVGIAGGLNAKVVAEELPRIVADYPDLSWDAEGQLHSINLDGKRPLDIAKTTEYLRASSDVLKGVY